MSSLRIRARRDTPETGEFDWCEATASSASRPWRPGDAPLSGECQLVVPSEVVTLQSVDVPAAQADRIGASLRFLVEDRMASDPEGTHVASVRPAKDRLCVAIVDRGWLQKTLARLRQAGCAARAAYPEFLLPPCPSGSWTVVCGETGAFMRMGQFAGLALGAVDPVEPPHALRIATREGAPQRIVARAAADGVLPDTAAWSRALGIPVQAGAPWDWTHDWLPELDLLQGEFAPRGAHRGLARWRRAAVLGVLAVALFSTGIALEWFVKSRERAQLLGEMAKLHRETFGDRVPAVDPPAQMRQAAAELRRQSGQALPGDFLPLLAGTLGGRAAAGAPRIHQLAYDGATLSVLVPPADAQGIVHPQADITTEPAQWGGQPAVLVKVRPRIPR